MKYKVTVRAKDIQDGDHLFGRELLTYVYETSDALLLLASDRYSGYFYRNQLIEVERESLKETLKRL